MRKNMSINTADVAHLYFTGAADNRIHALDFGGKGPTMVCLHGVTGNAWNWGAFAAGVRSRRRVVALDLRGYGESQWSPTGAYTTADHAADLSCVLDALETDAAVELIGSSWGALVAVAYAAENPGRVGRLVVVDVEPSFEQGETELFGRPRDHTDHDDAAAAVRGAYPNAPAEMVELVAATCYGPVDGGRLAPKHDPYFFERWPFRSDDHWDSLKALTMPTLHVHAANSFVRGEVMAQMNDLTPDSAVVSIDDSTHVVPVDNPSALIAAVSDFLDA